MLHFPLKYFISDKHSHNGNSSAGTNQHSLIEVQLVVAITSYCLLPIPSLVPWLQGSVSSRKHQVPSHDPVPTYSVSAEEPEEVVTLAC